MSSGSIAAKGRRAGKSPWVERLGRAGLVAKGVLYGVVAILAIDVALGSRKESPDKNGALRTIAEQPFGRALLGLLALGLAGYALWQLSLGDPRPRRRGRRREGTRQARRRAGPRGLVRRPLLADGVDARRQRQREQQRAAADGRHLRPHRRALPRLRGRARLPGAAAFNGYRAITCKFNKKLKQGEMSEAEEAAATGVGILGHLARAVVFGLIGVFLVKAAWEFDSKEARGLDGALLELAQQPYGGFLLGAVARRPARLRLLLLRAGALPPHLASYSRPMATIADGRTLPFDWYSNPDVLRLERERIFRSAWQYAGRADQVAEPGSFFTCDAGGVPVVVVRDKEAIAARVPERLPPSRLARLRGRGAGARRSSAPTTRGRTASTARSARRRAPSASSASTSRSSGSCPCRSTSGGRSSSSIRTPTHRRSQSTSASCRELVAAAGLDLDSLRFLKRSTSEYEANWKVCCENFLECYHCQVAHPAFSKVVDVSVDAYVLEQSATFSTPVRAGAREPGKATSTRAALSSAASSTSSGRTSRSTSCPATRTSRSARSSPIAAERTGRFLDYFVGPDVDDAWIADMLEFDNQVGAEDTVLVERVQKGLRSGGLEHGRLLLESERLIAHFQSQLVEALA